MPADQPSVRPSPTAGETSLPDALQPDSLSARLERSETNRAALAQQMDHVVRQLGYARGEITRLRAALAVHEPDEHTP